MHPRDWKAVADESLDRPCAAVYTISNNPSLPRHEVQVDLKDYRYLRNRGSIDSFGNVAEIEFYRDGRESDWSGIWHARILDRSE